MSHHRYKHHIITITIIIIIITITITIIITITINSIPNLLQTKSELKIGIIYCKGKQKNPHEMFTNRMSSQR
jgi:hypothetical protein